ncbi:MAG TPA: sulfite oxidase [Longimicrobium sp.]|nr:sulfite oxidase [Longimicrobium sp.]
MEASSTALVTPELISRGEDPPNLEMPFSTLDEWITPNEQFYVRCHFPIPEIDAGSWRLTVEGAVASPLELSLDDLRDLPVHTVVATLECAGNGRSFLQPRAKGLAWDTGAVGNARWTGVLLRDVLERAGLRGDAVEVILEGADRGMVKDTPRPPCEIHYARGVPLAKARADVLLAFAMNDEPLTPEHGFPLRVVVPGWFGMASVKWLQRVVVTDAPFNGYYQSIDYTCWEERHGVPTLVPLAEMKLKAQIARPAMHEVVEADTLYRVHGAAWAANVPVAAVEVSSDGGRSWAAAELLGEPVENAWRFWQFEWQTPGVPGRCTLIARAVDANGRTQPARRVQEHGTYVINHWLPVEVDVR